MVTTCNATKCQPSLAKVTIFNFHLFTRKSTMWSTCSTPICFDRRVMRQRELFKQRKNTDRTRWIARLKYKLKKRQHETGNMTGDGVTKKKKTQTGKNTHKTTTKTQRDALVYKKIVLKGHKFPRPQGKREKNSNSKVSTDRSTNHS